MDRFVLELDYLFDESHLLPMLHGYHFGINISIISNGGVYGILYKVDGSNESYNWSYKSLQYLTGSDKLFKFSGHSFSDCLEEINLDYFEEINIPSTTFSDGVYINSSIDVYEIKDGKVSKLDWKYFYHTKSMMFIFIRLNIPYTISDLIESDEKLFKFKPILTKLIKIE